MEKYKVGKCVAYIVINDMLTIEPETIGVIIGCSDNQEFIVKFSDDVCSEPIITPMNNIEIVNEVNLSSIGDKIRLLSDNIRKAGEIGVIVEFDYNDLTYLINFETADADGDYDLWLEIEEFELVNG